MSVLDPVDCRILAEVQADGRISNRELADRLNLSPTPCWRRLRRLEERGLIQRYTALLDAEALGLAVVAFAHVSLENHHGDTVAEFDRTIGQWAEVLECYSTSGDYDYMLKVVVPDLARYEAFLGQKLLQMPAVRMVNTSFALRQTKSTTELPLDYLSGHE